MSPRTVLVGLAAWALLAGCRSGPPLANGFPADLVRNEVTVVSQDYRQLTLRELIEVEAPAGATLTHAHVDWFVHGQPRSVTDLNEDIAIAQDGRAALSWTATIPITTSDEEVLSQSNSGDFSLTARGVLTLTWHQAVKEVDLSESRTLPAAKLLTAAITSTRGARHENGEASAILQLNVTNPNAFAVKLRGVHYRLKALGFAVDEGTLGEGDVIPASSFQSFTLKEFLDSSHEALLEELRHRGDIPFVLTGVVETEQTQRPFELKSSVSL